MLLKTKSCLSTKRILLISCSRFNCCLVYWMSLWTHLASFRCWSVSAFWTQMASCTDNNPPKTPVFLRLENPGISRSPLESKPHMECHQNLPASSGYDVMLLNWKLDCWCDSKCLPHHTCTTIAAADNVCTVIAVQPIILHDVKLSRLFEITWSCTYQTLQIFQLCSWCHFVLHYNCSFVILLIKY